MTVATALTPVKPASAPRPLDESAPTAGDSFAAMLAALAQPAVSPLSRSSDGERRPVAIRFNELGFFDASPRSEYGKTEPVGVEDTNRRLAHRPYSQRAPAYAATPGPAVVSSGREMASARLQRATLPGSPGRAAEVAPPRNDAGIAISASMVEQAEQFRGLGHAPPRLVIAALPARSPASIASPLPASASPTRAPSDPRRLTAIASRLGAITAMRVTLVPSAVRGGLISVAVTAPKLGEVERAALADAVRQLLAANGFAVTALMINGADAASPSRGTR